MAKKQTKAKKEVTFLSRSSNLRHTIEPARPGKGGKSVVFQNGVFETSDADTIEALREAAKTSPLIEEK